MNESQPHTSGRRRFFEQMAAVGLLPLIGSPALAGDGTGATSSGGVQEWPAPDDPHYWSWVRQQFSIPADEAYFNTGTLGACPRSVMEAVMASMRFTENMLPHCDYKGDISEYLAGYSPEKALRTKAGGVINAAAQEIALTQNATMGINFIANGLTLNSGDEVLITDQEHPGALGPWDLRAKRHGIVVKKAVIPIPTPSPEAVVKAFADAISPRTKVIAAPHVTSRYGIVMPVRDICALARDRDIFTLVDGAQAVGQLAVNVKAINCDAYANSPHKWLLAPPGNGLLYVQADRQKDVWATLASAQWDNYAPDNGLFRLMQFGTANAALLAGLDAAIDFYLRIGAEKVEKRIVGLADRLRDGLKAIKGATISSPIHPALAGAIVTYGLDGVTGQELQDALWSQKKFRVRSQSGSLVRQSVHLYNNEEEIDGTLEIVRSLARK